MVPALLPRLLATLYATVVSGAPQLRASATVIAGRLAILIENLAPAGNAATYILDAMRVHSLQQNRGGGALGLVHVVWTTPNTSSNPELFGISRDTLGIVSLLDGRVLFVGGEDSVGVASAECNIYDPSTGQLTQVASMQSPRYDPAVVLLADGRVLACGGIPDTGPFIATASAEIYDPVTNTWTLTGSMSEPRDEAGIVLLASGRVLVCGGMDAVMTNTAEEYDPATGLWTVVGPMAGARAEPIVIRLVSNLVLVAGGDNAGVSLDTCELYDPVAQTFGATGPLTTGRTWHRAVLLSTGDVLVVGGFATGGAALASCELYDVGTGTWAASGTMARARKYHAVVSLAGGRTVLAISGLTGAGLGIPTPAVELWQDGIWSDAGRLALGRQFFGAAALPSGRVVVAGGLGADGTETNLVELI
jgi:hypothetical protein